MKAFFHRLHLGGSKEKDRDSSKEKEKDRFPPLPTWPPQDPKQPSSSSSTPNSMAAFKPLPEIAPAQIAAQISSRPTEPSSSTLLPEPLPPPLKLATSSSNNSDDKNQESSSNTVESTGRSSRKTNTSNGSPDVQQQKKVAFISPPPTPVNLDRALPESPTTPNSPPQPQAPFKTTVSRFQAAHGKEPRGSVSAAASSSKTDVITPKQSTPPKAASTRAASPYAQKTFEGPSAQSLRSGTPYSSMSQNTNGSRILAASSWSQVTEDDLVSNIGSRERTRQEVLFEIIKSEERYATPTIYSFLLVQLFCLDMFKSLSR